MHDKRIKALMEKRDRILEQMNAIISAAVDENGEERALSEDEQAQFDEMEKQAQGLNKAIQNEERARDLEMKPSFNLPTPAAPSNTPAPEMTVEERALAEERAFENYIRGIVEERADVNVEMSDNGAIIPSTIANKIIERVYDICPIARLATRYNVKGTLSIPYYPSKYTGQAAGATGKDAMTGEAAPDITMAYASEFSELESTSGRFNSIELQSFLAGVLTKISLSLINNSQFNVLNFLIEHMADNVARWLERELLFGTTGKITGLSNVEQIVTAGAATAITADELIDLQETIPDTFQSKAVWIMNKSTRTAIRKLKDGEGNYLLNVDATARWGYRLLGADIYCSDNMPAIGANNIPIYYGDFSGLALKITENFSTQVLREKYATEHCVGVVGYTECDAKIENQQKIAALKCAATDPTPTS